MKYSVGQETRRQTINQISRWIEDAKSANPDGKVQRHALIRKIQLVIGATQKKAEEYCDLLEVF